MATPQKRPIWPIFVYVPNLIGYSRILFAFAAFYYSYDNPNYFFVFYMLSSILDAFDGFAARALGQATEFGAVLDMVTDRCATASLLFVLSDFYKEYRFLFAFLTSLDFTSHYIHMYATLFIGAKSHKLLTAKQHFILRLYYMNNKVLFFMCAGNELCYILLYIFHFEKTSLDTGIVFSLMTVWRAIYPVTWIICFTKNVINGIQLVQAAITIVNHSLGNDLIDERKVKKAT